MADHKKCPACAGKLEETAAVCSYCGLTDLNRVFLSREEYEAWEQQVLLPHKASLAPRVFAGDYHILVLTGAGALYGLGKNHSGQISDREEMKFLEPCLIATNVISAAAGYNYSIYVTADGQVHLQGRGIYAERFSGFSGAKQVFAKPDKDQFWIVNEQGKVYCFGENNVWKGLTEYRQTVVKELPERRCVIEYGVREEVTYDGSYGRSVYYSRWDTEYRQKHEIEMEIKASEEYRQLVRRFGEGNVELQLELKYREVLDGKSGTASDRREQHTYAPKILHSMRHIFTPVLYDDQHFGDLPHLHGSAPVEKEGYLIDQLSDIKKAVQFNGDWFVLREDGTAFVLTSRPYQQIELENHGHPICDIAFYTPCAAVAYQNGEVYWTGRISRMSDIDIREMTRILPLREE